MQKIKEQFGEITKEVRIKNNLSQEDMASELFLSGKQTIYYYEKGKRIMKLPEFVEFVQKFDEAVLIDKDGLSLVGKNFNTKNTTDEEKKEMVRENNSLVVSEIKGDVTFYKDTKSNKEYQRVEGIGLIPVVDGYMEYTTVKSYGEISIKYNTNGCHGYSIWVNDRCYEDRFWALGQVEEAVEEMFLSSQKSKTISVMVKNLKNKLEDEEIELSELDFDSPEDFLNSIDDLLRDGGQFRCEGFCDIATPYGLNFGEIESDLYVEATWECIKASFNILKEESLKTVICEDDIYSSKEIAFRYKLKDEDDNSYKVTLYKDNKKLTFTEFYFGLDTPNLETVINSIKDDYQLFKNSPRLSDYRCHRGEVDNLEIDYKSLKLDVKSMIEFFGKDYLDSLIDE